MSGIRAKTKQKRSRATGSRATRTDSPYIVFVSHSSRDAWIAKVIAEKIQRVGAVAWLDEKDIRGGDILVEKILGGIDACHEAVVLVSANSVSSQWVAFEIGATRAQGKRITPILNNAPFDKLTPMKDVKAIELNSFDKFIEELVLRLAGLRSK